jgi:hypothetical protein
MAVVVVSEQALHRGDRDQVAQPVTAKQPAVGDGTRPLADVRLDRGRDICACGTQRAPTA